MKEKINLFLFACLISILQINAQVTTTAHFRCGNEVLLPYDTNSTTSINNFVTTYNAQRTSYLNNPTVQSGIQTIPVVVHVLYNTPGENISYNQIQWAIAALNAGFQKNYPAYNGKPNGIFAVNTQIQFCLAQTPMGTTWTDNNEKGVMRYQVPATYLDHIPGNVSSINQLTNTTHSTSAIFPYQNYLNIWLVNTIFNSSVGGILAYSNFPNSGGLLDGIVIRRDNFGDNSVSGNNFPLDPDYDDGVTLVHEAGHYLNLLHTFEQVNNPTIIPGSNSYTPLCLGINFTNCLTDGDLLCDTPPVKPNHAWDCGSHNTCVDALGDYGSDLNEITEDFMSYGLKCRNTFTHDQAQRMQITLATAWPAGRADMVSTANAIATGGCCPINDINGNIGYTVTPCSYTYQFGVNYGCYNFLDSVIYEIYGPNGYQAPMAITNPNYSFTFPGPGTYTVAVDLAPGYDVQVTKVITILPFPTPIIYTSILPSTTICAGVTASITAGGGVGYYWNTGQNTPNISVTPLTTTDYTVWVTSNCGVTNSAVVTVNVVPGSPLTITSAQGASCPSPNIILTASGGGSSYAWTPGTTTGNPITVAPTVPTVYNASSVTSDGCIHQGSLLVNPTFCCSQGSTVFSATSGAPAAGVYYLNSPLTLTGNLTLVNTTIFMGTNAEIIIPNGVALDLRSVHLLGCPNMWKGIRCLGTTTNIRVSKTMIEDAITAIDLKNVTAPIVAGGKILDIADATFNKNFTAINIDSYLANTDYPQSITNTVFTCRKLVTNDHSTYLGMGAVTYNWATIPINNALKNTTFNIAGLANNIGVTTNDAFSVANFPSINLGIPNSGTISRQGIALTNVGSNVGTTFYNFYLNGGNNLNSLNVFDNMGYGINALNSNVKSSNAAYQNMSQYANIIIKGGSFPLPTHVNGAGINSENNTSTNVYNLDVSPAVGNYNYSSNLFFHNVYGIKTSNIQYTNIQYAMIHSNRVYTNTLIELGTIPKGEQGIYMQNPDYTSILVKNNFITNVNTGITFLASSAAYPAGSHLKNLGQVTITTNTLQADYATTPATGKALLNAIVADNLFNCKECIADDYTSTVRVVTNAIKSAFRGIKSSNWQHQFCYAADNNITLAQEPNGFRGNLTTQYGILHQNNSRDIVNSNVVTGFGIAKTTVYAIKGSDNFGQSMLCNSTSNTFEGFSFSGAQNTVTWQKNDMLSHGRALHINNTIIGQQGSATGAIENIWQAGGLGWAGINHYQTYITSSGTATSANYSKLFVKNNTLSNPTNNASSPVFVLPYQNPSSIIFTSYNSPYACSVKGGGGGPGVVTPIASADAFLILAANQIVTDSVPYGQYVASKQVNGKHSVYKYTSENTGLMTGNSTLQNFMAQAVNSNVANMVAVEKQLVSGDFTMATIVNNNIAANNSPESNAQLVYSLALKTKSNSYQVSDDDALLNLSNGCPDRDGLAVYQARVLYNSIHEYYTYFEDNCAVASGNRLGNNDAHQYSTAVSYDNLISIYPNPNTGNSIINLIDAGITNMQLKVYDVNGRIVFEDKAEDSTNKNYELNVDLRSGMYFVEVVDIATNTHYKQKLVIQQ